MKKHPGKALFFLYCLLCTVAIVSLVWIFISFTLRETKLFIGTGFLSYPTALFLGFILSLFFWFINQLISEVSPDRVKRKKMRWHARDLLIAVISAGSGQYVWYTKTENTIDNILAVVLVIAAVYLVVKSALFFAKQSPKYLLEPF